MQRRRSAILILSAVLVIVGAIFIGQGLGMLQGRSFMVGDRSWAVIGTALVIARAVLVWRFGRASPP